MPEITADLDAEAKSKNLGKVITQLKRDIEDIHVLVNPRTPPKKVLENKSAIEYLET